MKLAICNETFQGWPIEKICDYCAEAGYDGLEVAPFTLAESVEDISRARRKEIRKAAESAGIKILGLHWLFTKPQGLYLNHPEKSVRDKTLNYLKALMHFCADLGGSLLIFGSPNQRSTHADLDKETAWRYAVESIQASMKEAEACGVSIAMEPLAPSLTDFVSTASEGVKLIKEVNHPNFRLHLDVYSMSSESQPVEEIIRSNGQWLAHFHANDANMRGPGFGEVDFAPIAAALKDVGYNGYVSVEVFDYEPDGETIAKESLEYLKRFF